MSRRAKPLEERFWSKVDKKTTPDGCWTWTGCASRVGYGYIGMNVNGKWSYTSATRVVWELITGRPVHKGSICHICNNPSCVRPDHLYLGNHSTNAKDAVACGTWVSKRGEEAYNHILTWEQVREIRYLYSSRKEHYSKATTSQRKLATQFGVCRATIRSVLSHRNWKERS